MLAVVAVLAVALGPLVAVGAATGAAAADGAPPPTTAALRPVDRRLVDAGREVSAAEADRVALAGMVRDADDAIADLDRRIVDVDAELLPARTARDEVLVRLQGRAGTVYRQRSSGLGAALSLGGPGRLASGARYADALAGIDAERLARLQAVVDELEGRRAALAGERRDHSDARERWAGDLVGAQARSAVVGARLAALGGTPLMGASSVAADGLAAWFRSSGRTAVLAGSTTIEDLAALYVVEGGREGVRADAAFAQAVLETGWFAHARDNNFAGIGACDSCEGRQIGFATPQAGVRAQIQLLRNYADPDARAARLQHPPEPALHGADPATAIRTFDSFSAKGAAPVWDVMGGGRWATDPDYAGKVLALLGQIRAFTTR